MDTVWPDGTAAARPYTRSADGTRAFGAGVMDMKAGLVAAALVLEAAQRHGCAGAGPLRLVALFTSDEEVGSVVSRHAIAGAARGAADVFNTESGSLDGAVAAARKASLTLAFEVRGAAAHAGNAPQEVLFGGPLPHRGPCSRTSSPRGRAWAGRAGRAGARRGGAPPVRRLGADVPAAAAACWPRR